VTTYLADTNVIVRWVLPQDPLCLPATASVELLLRQGHAVHVSSQNLIEFWSVVTRPPSANGPGMIPAEAAAELDRIEAFFPLLEDLPGIHGKWRQLVQPARVVGRQAFDARLVA
jgi:hypothetical protein